MRSVVPDVLVLGGGGFVGEAWMSGFLAGAQQAWGVEFREANEFVGTSAGSIVAAHLAKGIAPRVPREPVHAALTDVTDRDKLMAGAERAFQELVTALAPDYTAGHRGQRDVGCVVPRRPPRRSAGGHAINEGTQGTVRGGIGIELRSALADRRG